MTTVPGIDLEAFFKISYGLYIVSAGNSSKKSGYISNAVFQVTAEPVQFAVCCSKNNYTASLISENRAFAISVLKKDADQSLISTFGYKSGKDIDKFSGVKSITGVTGAPIVTVDSLAWFECRVVQTIDVGTHFLFTAEIVNTRLIEDGEPLTYSHYREERKGKAPKNAPTYIDPAKNQKKISESEKYKCLLCGHVYDPSEGDPEGKIPAGTEFKDLPESWQCPICGADKGSFDRI
ncbi:MAG TPA: flavin reductase [Spirochaetota bacterium]|nr:flavin reductase [Spirochaetota bacterium]HPF05554.1 flavin reductase [Spirochaetota bacterium]HPJ41518.1 flavin reductase [Spirochaetota bacterium]HPR36879.1 flavin reductase [Spirochaetota bacterium]HRX48684.1 flavin reductase [Spirochaetota bacterium]